MKLTDMTATSLKANRQILVNCLDRHNLPDDAASLLEQILLSCSAHCTLLPGQVAGAHAWLHF